MVACLSALTLAGAALAPSLRFDFTPQAVFQGNDDLLLYDEEFKRVFGYQDAVLLVILEATGADDVLSQPALAWQVRSAGELQALADIQRVEALVLLQVPRRLPGVGLAVGSQPLLPPAGANARKQISEHLDRLPLVDGELISRDRRVTKLVLFADGDCREAARMRDLIARVQAALARSPLPPGFAVHLSGLPALRMDIVQGLREDLFFLLPLAGGLFLVILLGEFRRLGAALLPLAAVGAGLAWTVGIFVLCGQELNIVSNVLPVMLFVIGMANCVHMVSRYGEEVARAMRRRLGPARRTISFMLLACLLTSLTTMVGFGSLLAARSAVLQALGLHAIIGVGLLYVSTITVLGTLLPSIRARLTGDSYVHARAMDRFVRDLFWSLVSATAIIFCVIALLFWSLRVGLIAVLPNLAPLLVVMGYIALRGYELNAGNVVVFAVSIGIAVDNTIHFLARFREEIRLDGNVLQSIRRSFQSAGRAVVLATFLIVAGLSVLLFSRFVPSRRFAKLTGVTLLSALLGNLLLLPACLVLFWKPQRDKCSADGSAGPAPQAQAVFTPAPAPTAPAGGVPTTPAAPE